ncbi:MAG: zinc-uptake complex component a periplasmic [Verrucomicrobiales bacterium]|nr:zinc-uptake complex component a periplasmic [Verrucomicrobiales bacterium]
MKTAFFLRASGWLAALLWTAPVQAELKVATLHPLLTDLAHQVGGASVNVQAVVAAGTDMHHFSPSAADVKKLAGSTLVLVSGKNLENYLGKLQDNLTADQEMLEVGAGIPSLTRADAEELVDGQARRGGKDKEKDKDDDHDHDHGGVDPHWWNSVENMQRASKVLAAAFSKKDPANAGKYEANAVVYSKKLGELKKWARREISRIPADRRKLATSHLALSYFAREFGFRLIPVQGMNPEVPATSKDLAAAADTIRKNKITAVFPEQGVNPKHLTELSRETGVKFGGELIADGNGTGGLATFTGAFEHNVTEIVKALAVP